MQTPTLLFCFLCILLNSCSNSSSQQEATKNKLGVTVYQQHCAGCHGVNMEGASSTTLLKTEWLYGSSKNHFTRNVKYGISTAEMPAFIDILDDQQIQAVVDYVLVAQTTPPSSKREIPSMIQTQDYQLKVEQIITEGIEVPWAIEFVHENKALISERAGSLQWIIDGKLDSTPISGLPKTHTASSTGGYMDIALDPNYEQNGWIYLAFSHTDEGETNKEAKALTKIVRGKINNHQWIEEETLFEAPEELRPSKGNRWGCRFLFDHEGKLYFTIGDMAQAMDSQDLSKATGKVFRINPDGSIPSDNPFINTPDAIPAIFTIGNRNTQGLAQHPVSGEIWSTDHGPMGGDELNILRKGKNYGWPIITYGRDYSGEIVSELTHKEGMEQPIVQWTPSISVCPAEFCTSSLFPKWNNHLLVGALAFQEVRLLTIDNGKVLQQELILKNSGRVRDIKFSPDGALYVVLNNPDVILKITPEIS